MKIKIIRKGSTQGYVGVKQMPNVQEAPKASKDRKYTRDKFMKDTY